MLGFAPLSTDALSTVPVYAFITFDPDSSISVLAQTQMELQLRDRGTTIDYALDATVRTLGPAGVESHLYAATSEFISQAADTPANTPFPGILATALSFNRSIMDNAGFGRVTTGWGEIQLINTDGAYDDLVRNAAADGRRLMLKVGPHGAAYSGYWTLFDGTTRTWSADDDSLTFTIRDNAYKLEVPAQALTYGGTGGLDGGTDLKDQRKPRAFGWCENVAPPLVMPVQLVYQPSIGPVLGIDFVFDHAVPLTFAQDFATSAQLLAATTGAAGADIEAGKFATCKAEGLFRLGATPAGQVTCTLRGDASGTGYVNTTGAIVRRLAMSAAGLASADLVSSSFAAMDTAQPAEVGYYLEVGSSDTVASVVAELMDGVGGWAGMRRDGRFEARIFATPDGVPVASYDRIDIEEDSLSRERLPEGIDPPPFQYRVVWGRNGTVQTDVTGLSAVTADRVVFLAQEYRLAASEAARAAAIKLDHPLAQDPDPIQAFFRFREDAQAEANRRVDLYGVPRALYRFRLLVHPFLHEVGELIQITYPRWDLTAGKLLRIVSLTDDSAEDAIEVVAFC